MAACCRVYDSRHLKADCQEPGSAPEPYARQLSMRQLLSCILMQVWSSYVSSGSVSTVLNGCMPTACMLSDWLSHMFLK